MRIKNKNNLPKDFNLKNYDSLHLLSDRDLFRQLYWRSEDLDFDTEKKLTDYPEYGLVKGQNYPINNSLGDPFNELQGDDSFLKKENEYIKKEKLKILNMSYLDGVKPLTRFDILFLNKLDASDGYCKDKPIALDEGYIKELLDKDDGSFWSVMREPINKINDLEEQVMISLDLTCRDEYLIENITNLLPIWRKELNLPEPKRPISGDWNSVRKKILEYKIIPLIDLKSWAKATGNSITNGVLTVSLFPDGEKDSIVFSQTIIPFLNNVLCFQSLDKFKKEIIKNEENK
ncbi:DUF6387 family protein [Providencia rettgeri]|uniref:DUF6387 family protein n=1 Tax=Providencia rettgeri TaxID=587 RepID=UPI00214B996D|nr:DUF6387 family protein [Providencia rettgeri]